LVLDCFDRSVLLGYERQKIMWWDLGCSVSITICILGVIAILLWSWNNENK
jgi:hypothetical protein